MRLKRPDVVVAKDSHQDEQQAQQVPDQDMHGQETEQGEDSVAAAATAEPGPKSKHKKVLSEQKLKRCVWAGGWHPAACCATSLLCSGLSAA